MKLCIKFIIEKKETIEYDKVMMKNQCCLPPPPNIRQDIVVLLIFRQALFKHLVA